MRLGIAETLKRADSAPTLEEKTNVFAQNLSTTLLQILQYALDSRIKFALPSGPIEYVPNPLHDCENILYVESRRLYLFIEGGHPTLTADKRLKLFKGFLSNLAKEDAELMVAIKDKKLPYPTLTKDVIMKIFPNLLEETRK